MHYFAGLDFGTGGARVSVIDTASQACFSAHADYQLLSTASWRAALLQLISQIPLTQRAALQSLAICGTSATVVLSNAMGEVISSPLIYNDTQAAAEAEWLRAFAPVDSIALSPSSSLAKLAWLAKQPDFSAARYILHQADWLALQLHGSPGHSDYHNALKLGYDVEAYSWPSWIKDFDFARVLPTVHAPGEAIDHIDRVVARQLRVNPDCHIRAGTTDSVAAFIASGARSPGEAVTSLGSTLVLKLISPTRIENAQYGIYSHRFGDFWLTGGASNSGGAVLKAFYDADELAALSLKIDSSAAAPYRYYPLLTPGERFPINDPLFAPQLEPRPESDVQFLHSLLESIANIEARGYKLLEKCGAAPLIKIYSAGQGADNAAYQAIRERVIGKHIVRAAHTDAAFGAALLAKLGTDIFKNTTSPA